MLVKIGTVESVEGDYALVRAEEMTSHEDTPISMLLNPSIPIKTGQTTIQENDVIMFYALNEAGAKPGDTVRFSLPVIKAYTSLLETLLFYFVVALIILIAISIEKPVIAIGAAIIVILKLMGKNVENEEEEEASAEPVIYEIIGDDSEEDEDEEPSAEPVIR